MDKEILHLLEQGYTLLTPTMRLGRYLKNQYTALQLESDKSVWESPDILPWQTWLTRFWDDVTARNNTKLLRLSVWQRQNIWLQVVQNSDFAKNLLQHQNVAKRAVEAWDLSHQWQLPLFSKNNSYDVRAFQSWAHAYQQRCQAENWVDDACLADVLIEHLSKPSKRSKQKIALIGFEDIHPQQQALLSVLSDSGSEVKIIPLEKRNQQVRSSGFTDVYDEIDAVANWIRQLLQSNQHETIGVVVPGLQKLRRQIQTQFDDVLLTGAILSSSEPSAKPYSISLGQGLNSYPVIAATFSILTLVEQPFSIQDIGVLLGSPFIRAASEEKVNRALLDAKLREFGEPYLSISTLNYIANKYPEKGQCEIFLDCLTQWQIAYKEFSRTQSTQEWAFSFSKLLTIFNWPGERALNSAEYQTIQAWQELLARFASLDVVTSPLSYRAALTHLRQLAAAFSFQPETAEVPVQVMGTAGAAGMHFEHLWIMGLHEEAWPETVEANPFIPLALQRQHNLPHSSAESRLAHSRHMTECLVDSSADVFISYPQNEKERMLRPSPLIKSFLQDSPHFPIQRLPAYRKQVFNSGQFESFADDVGPAIESGQRVSGGTGLFKDQAACPFRAFARHRLYARTLERADIGLDPMERGSLLHDVMQNFWQKISGYSALLELTSTQEETRIVASIDAALAYYQKQRPLTFTDRFIALEKQRLLTLVREWLVLEKQRKPFRVIACEDKQCFIFADIEVHTRIDRIDELDDGRRIIIDYKTGEASVNAWFDDRPDEPQLPLYAVTSKADLAAIVFARIKRGESTFVGIANGEGIVPAVKTFAETSCLEEFAEWTDLLNSWKQTLSQLATEFRLGKALVNPKDAYSCRYCDLHAFCRIHEKTEPGQNSVERVDQEYD